MWLFAHLGLTLATAYCYDRATAAPAHAESENHAADLGRNGSKAATLSYPLIAIASVAPDADKLLNLAVYGSFERGVLHSLLGPLLLGLASLFALRRYRDSRLLQITAVWVFHLSLDMVWRMPRVLLWPALGWRTASGSMRPAAFLAYMKHSLAHNPLDFAPEIAGLAVLILAGAWACLRAVRSRRG